MQGRYWTMRMMREVGSCRTVAVATAAGACVEGCRIAAGWEVRTLLVHHLDRSLLVHILLLVRTAHRTLPAEDIHRLLATHSAAAVVVADTAN